MQAVRATAATLKAPDDWHFVVVCGEEGWTEYRAYAAQAPDALPGAVASTDLGQHETFLRGQMLNAVKEEELRRVLIAEFAKIAAGQQQGKTLARFTRAPQAGATVSST